MTLINNSVIEIATALTKALQKDITATNRLWLYEINHHLSNRRRNGSWTKYSISRLRSLIDRLGPKYLLE